MSLDLRSGEGKKPKVANAPAKGWHHLTNTELASAIDLVNQGVEAINDLIIHMREPNAEPAPNAEKRRVYQVGLALGLKWNGVQRRFELPGDAGGIWLGLKQARNAVDREGASG